MVLLKLFLTTLGPKPYKLHQLCLSYLKHEIWFNSATWVENFVKAPPSVVSVQGLNCP